jgi:release factor glutamine methyltransferase
MTIGEALIRGAALLRTAPEGGDRALTESPALDAALLLGNVLQTRRTSLLLRKDEALPVGAELQYADSLEKRRSGVCVAYITGRREFRALDFTVTGDVLVPRPDTETLVEAALDCLDRLPPSPPPVLLDLCTGSGAVAISLKHERPGLRVYGSDISPAALDIARLNAARLLPGSAAAPGVIFMESDLFEGLREASLPRSFDIITANPPYVPTAMIGDLAPEVQGEPRLALDGGEEGLDIIRRIITGAGSFLRPGGLLLLEADPRQMPALAGMLASGGYGNIKTYRDLSDRPRVAGGTFAPGSPGRNGEPGS